MQAVLHEVQILKVIALILFLLLCHLKHFNPENLSFTLPVCNSPPSFEEMSERWSQHQQLAQSVACDFLYSKTAIQILVVTSLTNALITPFLVFFFSSQRGNSKTTFYPDHYKIWPCVNICSPSRAAKWKPAHGEVEVHCSVHLHSRIKTVLPMNLT